MERPPGGDANDIERIQNALEVFRKTKGRPTFLILDSHIGYGSPNKQDTPEAHGEPLGDDEIRLTKKAYGWPEDAQFLVPDGVREHFAAGIGARGAAARKKWAEMFAAYRAGFPDLAAEIDQMQKRELPAGWDKNLPVFPADPKGLAGREASGKVLNVLAQNIPWFLGGSADLGPSNKTTLTFAGAGDFQPGTPGGKNLHYGIREHAMAATVNGLSLSKIRAFGATFFIFSDYARPAIRLSALMEIPSIFIFTHDAMGDGEDGPTHQPVEQLISLRAIPGLVVLRPGDANEVVEAYRDRHAASPPAGRDGPVAPAASDARPEEIRRGVGCRQGRLCPRRRSRRRAGGDPHRDGERAVSRRGRPREARGEGIRSRVVSMPSWDLFDHQPKEYQDSVLPPAVKARVAIEQASTVGWDRYVGSEGRVVGMKTFGASAPLKELQKHFGFEPEKVVAVAMETLGRS